MKHRFWPEAMLAALLLITLQDAAFAQHRGRRGAAAQNPPSSPYTQPEKQFPVGATWILKEFNGKPISRDDPPTFKLDENFRGSGFSSCNGWSATIYPQRGQRIAVGPIALTRKTCAKERMILERAFLTAIHSAPAWDSVGGDLVMKGPAGALRFGRSF